MFTLSGGDTGLSKMTQRMMNLRAGLVAEFDYPLRSVSCSLMGAWKQYVGGREVQKNIAIVAKGRAQKTLQLSILGLMLASCGGEDVSESAAGSPAQAAAAETPSKGPYAIGHVYDDGEFRATYLGLARLSLGSYSQWSDGECYAFLTEAERYNDHSNRRATDTFNPSTSGILNDGSKAERDGTGVDCSTKPLQALGYKSTHKAKLRVGESAKVWTGAFRLSAAQLGSLEGVSLYGSDELYVPQVSVEAP